MKDLHQLHESLAEHGPGFGCHITNCSIIAKKNHLENAKESFKNEDVDILEGHRVLGSVIGSASALRFILRESGKGSLGVKSILGEIVNQCKLVKDRSNPLV